MEYDHNGWISRIGIDLFLSVRSFDLVQDKYHYVAMQSISASKKMRLEATEKEEEEQENTAVVYFPIQSIGYQNEKKKRRPLLLTLDIAHVFLSFFIPLMNPTTTHTRACFFFSSN